MPAFFVERRKKGLALLRFLHGQLDTATLIHVENLHLDQVALIDVVRHLLNPLFSDLGDVQQAFST